MSVGLMALCSALGHQLSQPAFNLQETHCVLKAVPWKEAPLILSHWVPLNFSPGTQMTSAQDFAIHPKLQYKQDSVSSS